MVQNQEEKIGAGVLWAIALAALVTISAVVLAANYTTRNFDEGLNDLASSLDRPSTTVNKPMGTPTVTPAVPPSSFAEANAVFKNALKGVCPQTAEDVATITGSSATNWREDSLGGGRIWTFSTYPSEGASLAVSDGVFLDYTLDEVYGPSSTGPALITSKSGAWVCTARIPR